MEYRHVILTMLIISAVAVSGCLNGGVPAGGNNETHPCPAGQTAAPGDTANVTYTSRFTNGTVIYSGAISFIVGSGQVIEGFDEAVDGMCLSEVKHVSVPPEKAYGLYDPSNIIVLPVTSETNRTFTVTRDEFVAEFGRQPVVGVIYESADLAYPVRVGSAGNSTVMLEKAVTVGYRIEPDEGETWWPIDVISMTPDKIVFFRNVTDGTVIMTNTGEKVVRVADGNITIDMNNPLAGQTLLYDIELTGLAKG